MSVVTSNLFSGMKGSIGNIILYEVNGQLRMRSKPKRYTKSKSESQKAQKNKFKAVATFFNEIGVPMHYSWDEATRGKTMSGYNLFIKDNIQHFTATGEIAEYANLKISTGTLYIPDKFEMQYDTPNLITLQWEQKSEGDDRDLLQVAIYDPSRKFGKKVFWVEAAEVPRSSGKCTFPIPPKTGENLYFYVFFKSKFLNIFSDSRFAGSISRK